MRQSKVWKFVEPDPLTVHHLRAETGLPPLICSLLALRNIQNREAVEHFFNPKLDQIHDPFLMKNMDVAVDRLQSAIDNEEKILLYGDYDVDGTTAVALMYSFLSRRYSSIDYYLPDRYKEGYGISQAGIDYAKKIGATLIIAMDCGIKAVQQVTYARSLGIDVIICDHHLPSDELPPAIAILDPKQKDCPYPFKELSGCGITFKLVQAFEQRHNIPIEELTSLLDYLVISIASDIVPIIGENRILAHAGLKQLNHTHRQGLLALIEQSKKRRPLNIQDIVFGLAPMINAAGRLADAELAVKLLLARKRNVAQYCVNMLEMRNNARREFDQQIAEEAESMLASNEAIRQQKSIVLYQPHWHRGVIGIVASRISERHHKPTIILTKSEGKVVGSARSVGEFDIYEVIAKHQDMLINYGGHKYAAGLTMEEARIPEFVACLEDQIAETILPQQQIPELPISAEIHFKDLTPELWRHLRLFAPFGPGNPQPIFLTCGVRDAGSSRLLNGDHLRLALRQGRSRVFYGIAFGMAEFKDEIATGRPFDICYTVQRSAIEGRKQLQLVIKDLRWSE